ncbi:MAG: HD domain-containing protein [Rhizobiales bacterium]|nr:HD domain-containing protein [Hyphomicrobiales bacterium]MBI3672418.1 HD domain-containing protein [Hyphomicrobiales bacterium]
MAAPAVRRADFLMALAYATDLATGQSRDFALRSCVLAMRLAEAAHLDINERRNVYHQALLRYIGCNADTHLLAAAFGDEIAMRQDLARIDLGNHAEVGEIFVRALTRHHAGATPEELAGAIERGLAEAMQVSVPILAGHCEVAQRIGARVGLSPEICDNLGKLYERWDGRGLPRGLKGDEVTLAVRLVSLAQDAIVLAEVHGTEAMQAMIAKRRGGAYEPALADLFLADAAGFLKGLDGAVDRETILALEPAPHAILDAAACEDAYVAIADMVDMRMPFTYGHSRAVAALAAAAAKHMGLPASDIRDVRWAAYTHDIGELAVPVSTWMKSKPLTVREIDTIRLHPYHGERALAALGGEGRAVAALVLRHHERLDGSGYHRYVRGSDLSPTARILAAAEAFQTAREARPYRPALSDAAAAAKLRSLVREGRLCPEAVEAVLSYAGQPARRDSAERLAGLTPREIEVLRLIAAGQTAKEVARHLEIAPKTADNHIQSLYSKIGVTTRAAAALYAVERGLVQYQISAAA